MGKNKSTGRKPAYFFSRVYFPADSIPLCRSPVQPHRWTCAWAGWTERVSKGPGGYVGRTVLGCQNTPSASFIDLSFGPEASPFAAFSLVT